MTLAVSYEKRIVFLNISYNRYISHILGYQVVKFDWAGVLGSRHIGLQPSPMQLVSVNAYCFGVMASQDINFRGSLPLADCVSLHKTYIGWILHILGYIDVKFDGQYSLLWVDITVQPCKSGLITVFLCIPEPGPQNGVGCLLQKLICLPTDVLTWIHFPYARVRCGKFDEARSIRLSDMGDELSLRKPFMIETHS